MTTRIEYRPTANELRKQLMEMKSNGAYDVVIGIDLEHIVEELNKRDAALRFYLNHEKRSTNMIELQLSYYNHKSIAGEALGEE